MHLGFGLNIGMVKANPIGGRNKYRNKLWGVFPEKVSIPETPNRTLADRDDLLLDFNFLRKRRETNQVKFKGADFQFRG